jgi:hypothetical protein
MVRTASGRCCAASAASCSLSVVVGVRTTGSSLAVAWPVRSRDDDLDLVVDDMMASTAGEGFYD